jgi:hypothetical protein
LLDHFVGSFLRRLMRFLSEQRARFSRAVSHTVNRVLQIRRSFVDPALDIFPMEIHNDSSPERKGK